MYAVAAALPRSFADASVPAYAPEVGSTVFVVSVETAVRARSIARPTTPRFGMSAATRCSSACFAAAAAALRCSATFAIPALMSRTSVAMPSGDEPCARSRAMSRASGEMPAFFASATTALRAAIGSFGFAAAIVAFFPFVIAFSCLRSSSLTLRFAHERPGSPPQRSHAMYPASSSPPALFFS